MGRKRPYDGLHVEPKPDTPYNFPTHRDCDFHDGKGLRATGRWVTKKGYPFFVIDFPISSRGVHCI